MQTYCGAQHVRLLMPLPQHTSARKYINMEKSEQIENVWKWIKWSLIELSRLNSIPRFFFWKAAVFSANFALIELILMGLFIWRISQIFLPRFMEFTECFDEILRKYKFCQAKYFAWHGTRFPPVPKEKIINSNVSNHFLQTEHWLDSSGMAFFNDSEKNKSQLFCSISFFSLDSSIGFGWTFLHQFKRRLKM